MNLAKKLINGVDPLNGQTLEDRLTNISVGTISNVYSNKNEVNHRNKELILNKKIANS
jgi:fructose-1,6-bisphosphatase